MVNRVAGLNQVRFAGHVVTTAAFETHGSPTAKGYASRELATMAKTLNDRLVVRADHADGVDRVDLYLNKGFREFRPVVVNLGPPPKHQPGANELPFQFDVPTPVLPGKSRLGGWWARRQVNKTNAANTATFLTQVLAKARFLSEWEDANHLMGIPGLRVI